jgi:hypothetical protein
MSENGNYEIHFKTQIYEITIKGSEAFIEKWWQKLMEKAEPKFGGAEPSKPLKP